MYDVKKKKIHKAGGVIRLWVEVHDVSPECPTEK